MNRRIETLNPSPTGTGDDEDTKSLSRPKPQSMKTGTNKIILENPRTLSEGEGIWREKKQEKEREERNKHLKEIGDQKDQAKLRERGEQSSIRMCQRGTRKIPVSHQREKAQFTLPLNTMEQQVMSPDEPTHVPLSELTKHQEEFKG